MAESLPALIARRQKERGAPSLRALYSLAELSDGGIGYVTLRRLSNGEQRGSRDSRVPRDLAMILGVPNGWFEKHWRWSRTTGCGSSLLERKVSTRESTTRWNFD